MAILEAGRPGPCSLATRRSDTRSSSCCLWCRWHASGASWRFGDSCKRLAWLERNRSIHHPLGSRSRNRAVRLFRSCFSHPFDNEQDDRRKYRDRATAQLCPERSLGGDGSTLRSVPGRPARIAGARSVFSVKRVERTSSPGDADGRHSERGAPARSFSKDLTPLHHSLSISTRAMCA